MDRWRAIRTHVFRPISLRRGVAPGCASCWIRSSTICRSSRSNLRTEEYLTSVSRAEGLDLQVSHANPTGLGLHNKMVLAEIGGRGWSMIGSLNGGEASAKVNREVSVIVQSDELYRYLAEMFWGDWSGTAVAQS